MISKFLAAALLACAGLFAGLFSTVAAPASADCAPSFTSIPCTIATNVAQAPATLVGGVAQSAANFAGQGCAQPTGGNASGNESTCGVPGVFTNAAGIGCPPDSNGNSTEPCGVTGLPENFATGAQVIATAPQTIAGNLAAAPAQLAGGLLAAPGQFLRAIQNGGTDPGPPSDSGSTG